jgi:hypothetical protein
VNTFLENAQRIFDVAREVDRTDSGAESSDFALLVRPDGSLHVVMETEMNLDAVAIENGARTAYRVSRSERGVRVTGRQGDSRFELSGDRKAAYPRTELLRDQPLYLLAGHGLLASQGLIANSVDAASLRA